MKILFLFLISTSISFAGKLYQFKGKFIGYNTTHAKFEVDGKVKKLPLKALDTEFRATMDSLLGKEVEIASLVPLE